jgi:hypothetical protein
MEFFFTFMKKILTSTSLMLKGLAITAFSCLSLSVAAQMAPGNIVVNTVGNGSSTLSNAAWRVNARVINQANGNTLNNFSGPVNPSSGNKLSNSGSATSEGSLNLSLNGRYLTMVGYNADSTQTSVANTASSSVARVIARIDSAGNYDVTTSTSSRYTANNFRGSSTENGSTFYVSGAGSNATNAGLKLYSLGDTTQTTISTSVGGTNANLRWSGIFAAYDTTNASLDKSIYVSTGAGTQGIYQIGSGLPTSSTASFTQITSASNPYGFVFLDASTSEAGLDLLYASNDGSNIQKYYKNAGTWTAAGTFSVTGVRGITGYITAEGRVKLIVTRGGSGNLGGKLVNAWDNSAYNATINLQNNSNNNLSLSNYNVLFSSDSTLLAQRGVAFTPTSISSHPSNSTVCSGASTSFTLAMYAPSNSDSAVYNYYWQRSTDGGATWAHVTTSLDGGIYSNTRSASLSVNNPTTSVTTYQYRCLVQYMSLYWLTSEIATLTVIGNPIADAGSDIRVCTNASAQLNAVDPIANQSGLWYLFLGGGTIANPSNPNTNITGLSQSATYMWILSDDLNVCPPDTDFVFVETVPRPTSLSVGTTTSTTAVVQWSSSVDPDSFLVRYQKNCTGTYYYAWVGGTLRQATLTGLDACTNYCFRVRAQCTGSATPQYSSTTGTFTTGVGASCVAVTNVTIANTSACTYNVSWSNCVTADSFRVRYKLSSASVWSFSPWSTAYSANITMGPGSWMVRVQSKCGTTIYTTSTTNYSIGSCRIAGENASAFSEMVLFPNPTATQSLLNFSSTIDANYTIAISDLSGRVLRTNEGSAVTGENTAQISVDGLSKGVYIVALSLNGETRQVKLNVQ